MTRKICLIAGLVVFAGSAVGDTAPARTVTLAQAIEIALTHNPQLAIETENIVISDARTRADQTLRLPLLGLKANVLLWDRAIVVQLGPDPNDLSTKVTVRERVTGTADLSIVQPLSGALVIGQLIERDRALTAASRAQRDGARVDIAYQTAEAYLGSLQAQTLGKVAAATLQKLDADLEHGKLLVAAGALQAVDVLRIEVEHARIEQQALEAEASSLDGRRRLALLLGLPDGAALALVELDTAPPQLAWTEDDAVLRARRDRAEARVAGANRQAAELDVAVARASYYPSVGLVGVYSHAISSSFATTADSAYLGVTLDWNVWDWGNRGADVDTARALGRQARLREGALVEHIAVAARARWNAARTAYAKLGVTARGLAAAVEAQRVLAARFAQGAATTVDLLDAETALANAESQAVVARYQYLVAWMALGREVGSVAQVPQ